MLRIPLTRVRAATGAVVACAAVILGGGAASAHAAPALVGQWRFDEGAGQTVHDDGPLGLHGVLGSSTAAEPGDPLWVAGASGSALRMNGSSYVTVADQRKLDLRTMTVEAVARADGSPGAYRYLVSHGSRECFAGSYGLYTARNGGLAFYVFDGERFFVSASADPGLVWDGAPHRLAGTFDGETVRAFVDGRAVGNGLATPPGTAVEYESMPPGTYFGVYLGSCQLAFTGELDSVRIWSGTATSAGDPPRESSGAPQLGAPIAPDLRPGTIVADLPASSCVVRASRKWIMARRRATVAVRALDARGRPLRRVRLAVRRTDARSPIASRRTNSRGAARFALRVSRRGRLRIGVVARPNCTPAFVRVTANRPRSRLTRR